MNEGPIPSAGIFDPTASDSSRKTSVLTLSLFRPFNSKDCSASGAWLLLVDWLEVVATVGRIRPMERPMDLDRDTVVRKFMNVRITA